MKTYKPGISTIKGLSTYHKAKKLEPIEHKMVRFEEKKKLNEDKAKR